MSETSQEELLHDHLCDLAKERLDAVESDLTDLREECEVIYVETGSLRAKLIASVLLELEKDNHG